MKQDELPLRVLHYIKKVGTGGGEAFLMNIYRNINRQKLQFDFLVNQNEKEYYDEEIIAKGGRKICLFSHDYNNTLIKIIKSYHQIYRLLKEKNYDIIHIHSSNAQGFIYAFAAKKAGVKVRIVHSHNTGIDGKFLFLKKLAHKFLKKYFEKFTTDKFSCSRLAADWMYSKKVMKLNDIKIIHNGIDIKKYIYNYEERVRFREELGIDDKFVIIHIGRFNAQKNHIFLLDIFLKIYMRDKNAVLLLIGEGELEYNIRNKVKELNLEEVVRFIGTTNIIPHYLWASDLFLFPSLYEGLGIVTIEAQAAGLKIIVSDRIPKEAYVTNYIECLSLNASDEKWAEKALEYKNGYVRRNTYNELNDSGYDIKSVANELEKYYFKRLEEYE